MTRPAQIAALVVVLLASAAGARGEYRYEPPELGPSYVEPQTATPPPEGAWGEYVAVAALVVAIALASYLALRRRSRAWIVALAIGCLVYFGFIRKGCVCPIGAIQNVAQGIFDTESAIRPDHAAIAARGLEADAVAAAFEREYARFVGAQLHRGVGGFRIRLRLNGANRRLLEEVGSVRVEGFGPDGRKVSLALRELWRVAPTFTVPWTVLAFFLLPLAATLLFGRAFCASVCPLGVIQDVVVVRPLSLPQWSDQALRLFAYVYLAGAVLLAATGSAYIICRYDPFVSFFRLGGSAGMFALGACFLLIGMFVARPYCRFLCPYGAILRVLSRFSRWRVTITPDECIRCRLCEDACPFGAIRKPTEELPPGRRRRGKPALALLILALPVLIALGAWLGHGLRSALAGIDPTVRLADAVRSARAGETQQPVEEDQGRSDAAKYQADMVAAFEQSQRGVEELYEEESIIRGRFAFGAVAFGAFIGLIVGGKLIQLSVRRRRTDYEADRATCLACGRCFRYCPREQARRKGRRTDQAGEAK